MTFLSRLGLNDTSSCVCACIPSYFLTAPASITPASTWNLPAVSLASPWHHLCITSVLPGHSSECSISLNDDDVLKAEQLPAGLGYCKFLVLMFSSASLLPCLTPASALCTLALWQGGFIAEEASRRFVGRVCSDRGVMTPAHSSDACFQPGPICDVFIFFFSSLCLAQAAPGEVARRHIRPCAHYACINSIRKSSGQTFQSSTFNSSRGRLYWQPGDFQGVWTCAFILLFCLLIPTAVIPTSPEHMALQLFHPSYSQFPSERSPRQLHTGTRRALQ